MSRRKCCCDECVGVSGSAPDELLLTITGAVGNSGFCIEGGCANYDTTDFILSRIACIGLTTGACCWALGVNEPCGVDVDVILSIEKIGADYIMKLDFFTSGTWILTQAAAFDLTAGNVLDPDSLSSAYCDFSGATVTVGPVP